MDWHTCFKGKKVLLAEDDPANQELMKDILGGMQIEFDIAKDGNEAVQKASATHFDLIIMDIRLPNKDGIQATKEIRATEKGDQKIPIIALSASIVQEEKRRVLEAGVNELLSKPINLEEFRKSLAKAWGIQ